MEFLIESDIPLSSAAEVPWLEGGLSLLWEMVIV